MNIMHRSSIFDELEALLARRVLILDGCMHTMMQQQLSLSNRKRACRGYGDDKPEFASWPSSTALDLATNDALLSLTMPQAITDIHCRFLAAGADIIRTNTASAHPLIQGRGYLMSHLCDRMNKAAVRLCKQARDEHERLTARKCFVAGAVGLTACTSFHHQYQHQQEMLFSGDDATPENASSPSSSFDTELATAGYKTQIKALLEEGVDLLFIETVVGTIDAKCAIFAARSLFEEEQSFSRIEVPIMISGIMMPRSWYDAKISEAELIDAFYCSVRHANALSYGLSCEPLSIATAPARLAMNTPSPSSPTSTNTQSASLRNTDVAMQRTLDPGFDRLSRLSEAYVSRCLIMNTQRGVARHRFYYEVSSCYHAVVVQTPSTVQAVSAEVSAWLEQARVAVCRSHGLDPHQCQPDASRGGGGGRSLEASRRHTGCNIIGGGLGTTDVHVRVMAQIVNPDLMRRMIKVPLPPNLGTLATVQQHPVAPYRTDEKQPVAQHVLRECAVDGDTSFTQTAEMILALPAKDGEGEEQQKNDDNPELPPLPLVCHHHPDLTPPPLHAIWELMTFHSLASEAKCDKTNQIITPLLRPRGSTEHVDALTGAVLPGLPQSRRPPSSQQGVDPAAADVVDDHLSDAGSLVCIGQRCSITGSSAFRDAIMMNKNPEETPAQDRGATDPWRGYRRQALLRIASTQLSSRRGGRADDEYYDFCEYGGTVGLNVSMDHPDCSPAQSTRLMARFVDDLLMSPKVVTTHGGTGEKETSARSVGVSCEEKSSSFISRRPLLLLIDSSNFDVMLAGIRRSPWKVVANSISLQHGETEFIRQAKILRRHGAAVIVRACDESWHAPEQEEAPEAPKARQLMAATEKIDICKRSFEILRRIKFPPEDIIFDPILEPWRMSADADHGSNNRRISSSSSTAIQFLDVCDWIKKNLPACVRVCCGVSNLSIGDGKKTHNNNVFPTEVRQSMHIAFLREAITVRKLNMMVILDPGSHCLPPHSYDVDPKLLAIAEDAVLPKNSKDKSAASTCSSSGEALLQFAAERLKRGVR